jgi:2-polyprenyl-3-methyl-5-hydroxy-6-metoxy-1,4-benzoquinol methylase
MKHPEYDPGWSDLVKAVYAHDMQEMWDSSILPHIFNCYHAELKRYLCIAGKKPLRILDVGCAQGTLALLLAEAGHHVTAVDLRQELLDYAVTRYETGNIDFLQGNAMELGLSDSFDLIFSNQILEHLVYPVQMVSGLSKLLAPGGRFVATTPNGSYFKSKLTSFRGLGDVAQYENRQFFPDGDAHFFAYLAEELRQIVSEAGLVQIDVTPYSTPWITGHVKVRFLHGRVPVAGLSLLDRISLGLPGVHWLLAYQLMVSGVKAS